MTLMVLKSCSEDLSVNPDDFGVSVKNGTNELFCGGTEKNISKETLSAELMTHSVFAEDENSTSAPLLNSQVANHMTIFANFLLSFVICSGNILTVTAICKNHRLQVCSMEGHSLKSGE